MSRCEERWVEQIQFLQKRCRRWRIGASVLYFAGTLLAGVSWGVLVWVDDPGWAFGVPVVACYTMTAAFLSLGRSQDLAAKVRTEWRRVDRSRHWEE